MNTKSQTEYKKPETGKQKHSFVFLDRDGVINVESGDYILSLDQWEWAPCAFEGIKLLTDAGFGIIVVTNKSCIGMGLQTEEELAEMHEFMIDRIRKNGGNILRIYHCPHQDSDNCSCRKPKPGMLLEAAEEYGINLHETFFIGDAPRDIEAGRRAGTRTILIDGDGTNIDQSPSEPADFRANNLLEAAQIVIHESTSQ